MLMVNLSILGSARAHWVLPRSPFVGLGLVRGNQAWEVRPHESIARHYNLIIFQLRNGGKPELGLKVAHRTALGAKFRPKISLMLFVSNRCKL